MSDNDFSPKTKETIAEMSAYCCGMPHCRIYTKETDIKWLEKKSGFGQAAHIYSSSKKNKTRTQIDDVTDAFVASFSNGMWLCANCHIYADYPPYEKIYDVDLMKAYKKNIEEEVSSFLKSRNKTYNQLDKHEKKELHKELFSRKEEIPDNMDDLSVDERFAIAVQYAIRKISVNLDQNTLQKINQLEAVSIDINNFHFHNVNNHAKKIFGKNIKLRPYQIRNFLINFKKNKNIIFNIKNCELTRDGTKSICKGSFFDKNSSFHKIFMFLYIFDEATSSINVKIEIQLNELFHNNLPITDCDDFKKILAFLEAIENDEVKIQCRKHDNEKYLIINDYQKVFFDIGSFKHIIGFLSIVQHVAIQEGLNITITPDLYDKNLLFRNSLDLLYSAIILENIPSYIKLGNLDMLSLYHYDFETIYNNVVDFVYIYKDFAHFDINLQCKTFNIQFRFDCFDYLKKYDSFFLSRTEDSCLTIFVEPHVKYI
jgi:hypothetical protein